jgi:hypothetical protein
MNFDVERQVQLGRAEQALAQDFLLDLKLVLVAGVLVAASAAVGEVRTGRQYAVRRGLDDRVGVSARETPLLPGERSLDLLGGQNKRNEHCFSARAGIFVRSGGVRSGGQTGEAVAAVDQLFDCEEQDLILRHGKGMPMHRNRRHARTRADVREIPHFA